MLVDEPKTADITATTKKDAIDTPIVETVKNTEVANIDAKLVEVAVKADELKALNTNSTSNDVAVNVNKTTTTVTVNVTQTKVTVGDVVDKGHGIGEVVSSVSSIAEAAVGAIEHEIKKPAKIAEANSIEADVEMADADEVVDCEMKDVSLVEEQPQVVTTTTTSTVVGNSEIKSAEADSVNSSTATVESTAPIATNEAEQKIDDVEKNISNLFNGGDDNIVSTNDKSSDGPLKADNSSSQIASSQSGNSLLKNGTDSSAKETQLRHDAIKDNNDLVSILAGNDKPEENISSSSAQKPATSEKDAKSIGSDVTTKNQITSSSSTPSKSTTTQSNVVNNSTSPKSATTTTAQKQSEKVAIAGGAGAIDAEKGLGGKATRQEIISSLSSTKEESSSDLSSTVSGWFSNCQTTFFFFFK